MRPRRADPFTYEPAARREVLAVLRRAASRSTVTYRVRVFDLPPNADMFDKITRGLV